jgi:hypothetical protein
LTSATGRDPASIDRGAALENDDGDAVADLGVTLLTVACNGPDYDLSAVEALCRWRDRR